MALSIGIVMGSGVLGGPLLDDLEKRADRIRDLNSELRAESADRLDRINQLEDFLEESEPYLLNGTLVGEEVVLFELPGVSTSVTEELQVFDRAGGREPGHAYRDDRQGRDG